MTYRDIAAMVEEIGVPTSYYQFPRNTEIAPPFVCFFFEDSDDFTADNKNYQKIRPLSIELYTDAKDYGLEQTVEDLLDSYDLPYSREETYIENERLYMVTYTTDIIITEE